MNSENTITKKRGRPRKHPIIEPPTEKPTIGRPRQYDRNDIALIKQVKKQNNTQYYNNRGYFITKVKYYMNKHPDLNITPDTYIDKPVEELKDILTGIEARINEKRLRHIEAKQAEINEKRKQQQQAILLQKLQKEQERNEYINQKQQENKIQKQHEKIELIKQKQAKILQKQAEKLQKQQHKNEIIKQKQAEKLQKQQHKNEIIKQKQAEKLQKQQQKKEQAINMKIERITQPDKPVANNFKPRQIKMKIM